MSLRHVFASALLVATAGAGAACHRMAAINQPAEYIDNEQPARIWVTRPSGDTFIVEGPQLMGDTLVGYINGEYREIEFAGDEAVVVRQPAPVQTALVVVAGIAGVAGLGSLLSSGTGSGGDNPRWNQDCYKYPDQPDCQ